MTPNSCFIFRFLPELVLEPYTNYYAPYAPDFTVDELLDLPKHLQQAYDDSLNSEDYPYDTSRLTIRKSGDIDETFHIIEFAPREEEDQTYAVKAVVHTIFDESRYYTVEESAARPGKYLLCHPEVGRHSLLRQSWDHIPTDEELIEAVSTLGINFDKLRSHIDMLEADYKQASASYREFRERQKHAAEGNDEDNLLVGCADHSAFSALEMLDYEISRKQSFLQKKLQECNGGMSTAEQWNKRFGARYSAEKLTEPIASRYDRVFRLGSMEPPLFVCEKYHRKGVVDEEGKEIIPCEQYEIFEQIDADGVIPFLSNGKWGLCHFGVCTEAIFDEVIIHSEEYCQVMLKGQKGWIDSEGKFTQNQEDAWFGSWYNADK